MANYIEIITSVTELLDEYISNLLAVVVNVGADPPAQATVDSFPLAWSNVFQLVTVLLPLPSCFNNNTQLQETSGKNKFRYN